MEIFILILKIIGILLAVFILLIGAVLAVPVRYRVDAGIEQQKVSGSGVLFWLFHIIDFRIWYGEDGLDYKLRIFGILIDLKREKKQKPDKVQKEEAKVLLEEQETSDRSKIKQEGQERNNKSPRAKKERRRPRAQKPKKKPFWRIRRFWKNLKQRFSDMMDGAKTVKEKIQNIKKLISDETNKSAFVKVWRELKFLIRHYSPRRAKGELAFGMEDPSQTGQILGAMSVLPFWARYKINIYPDFQAETFFVEGRLWLKGHIRLWHLLLSVIRLIKNKNVRLLLGKIRT